MKINIMKIITADEGFGIVSKEDYEKEISMENKSLSEGMRFYACRSSEVCLPGEVDENNYMEVPLN